MKFYSKKLKRFFAIICAFLIISEFSLSDIPVKAAETTPKITYTVTGEATVGKQITINLNVSNINGLYGGSWDFAYDPSILKVDEITSGELTSSIPQTTTSNKSGHAYFWFTKTGDTTGVSTTDAKSIAKIKATVLKEGTVKIGTTNSDSSFGVNNKSSLVKLSDKNGDKIGYSSEDKSLSCIKTNVILTPGTYQENNSSFLYLGNWVSKSSSSYNGGTLKTATSPNSFVEFKFNGTSFEWYGNKASSRGIAKVYIDDVLTDIIDCYNPSTLYDNILYSSKNLSSGSHTVKIIATGTKNSNSSNFLIDIDRIVIKDEPVLTPGTYQENNSSFLYSGNWVSKSSSSYNGGTLKTATSPNSFVEFKFNGTSFEWYGNKASSRGIAKVYIDDVLTDIIDCYNPSTLYDNILYSSKNLSSGSHTVKIIATGTKNSNSSNFLIDIDRIVIK